MFNNFARKLANLFRIKSAPQIQRGTPITKAAPAIGIPQLIEEARANGVSGRSWAPNPHTTSYGSGRKPAKVRPFHCRHRRPPRPNIRNPRGRAARRKAA